MGQPKLRDEQAENDHAGATMGFLEHLDELRTRLIRACAAVLGGMLVSCFFIDRIAGIVMTPMLRSLPANSHLIYIKPGESFAFYLDLALLGGVVLAAPFVTWQAWRFIAPGLYRSERRLVVPLITLAVAGTAAGTLFAHFLLFPGMMEFFAAFDSPNVRFMPRIEDTFALYKNTLIGMVAVFQVPTLVYVLAKIGAVTARFLWTHVNYAVMLSVIAAAFLTPSPDPWNQLLFAAPMLGMYLVGIVVAWLVQPRTRASASDSSDSALRLVFAASVLEQARRGAGRRAQSTSHLRGL
jgi:sec-independent protein translocase protein TatC